MFILCVTLYVHLHYNTRGSCRPRPPCHTPDPSSTPYHSLSSMVLQSLLSPQPSLPSPPPSPYWMHEMSAWSRTTRRAPSRYCRGAKVYGNTNTGMLETSTPPPAPPVQSFPPPIPYPLMNTIRTTLHPLCPIPTLLLSSTFNVNPQSASCPGGEK